MRDDAYDRAYHATHQARVQSNAARTAREEMGVVRFVGTCLGGMIGGLTVVDLFARPPTTLEDIFARFLEWGALPFLAIDGALGFLSLR